MFCCVLFVVVVVLVVFLVFLAGDLVEQRSHGCGCFLFKNKDGTAKLAKKRQDKYKC